MDRNNSTAFLAWAKRKSPPARVAWIETITLYIRLRHLRVATREGGVDRNIDMEREQLCRQHVATREGGVDRNNGYIAELHKGEVATREGGVDRNLPTIADAAVGIVSPPARVAWIETDCICINKGERSRHPRGWRG